MSEFAARLQAALGSAYGIESELPLGRLGRRFLATEVATGRRVSVVAVLPDVARRLDANRLLAAADRAARLRHAGIVPLVAVHSLGDVVCWVWLEPPGESLRERLLRGGGLSPREGLEVLHQVADALAYAHEHGVCHGDLRTDTIHLDGARAAVAELGLRSALNAALGCETDSDAAADVHDLAVVGQQLLADRRGPVAAALARALSIDPSAQFPTAAGFRDSLGSPPSAARRRLRYLAAACGVLALALVGVVRHQMRRPALDPGLVAVAPFEIPDPALAPWREGLVTMLSANLDGAGLLRTVPPRIAVRRWSGSASTASAVELGRLTLSRLVLIGRVQRAGGDTLLLAATLVDAERGAVVADVRLSEPSARLDRLADNLTARLLRKLGKRRPPGALHGASLGSSSLAALESFFEGERQFRKSRWDSALSAYRRAIDLDSTFALALYRAGISLGWQSSRGDSLAEAYLIRAAAHNRGLPRRDSLLLVAESLAVAVERSEDQPRYWEYYRRLYAATALAAQRYPRDPEVWYEYGDVRHRFPFFSSLSEMRDAFDRAIALDSSFAPAYVHPIQLALELGEPVAARRYMDRYLSLDPRDAYADGIRLTRRLLDPGDARSREMRGLLDTASADLLSAALRSFRGWADTLETGVRLARLLVTRRRGALRPREPVPDYLPEFGSALAYHGHLQEAYARAGRQVPWLLAALAWMGGVPRDTAAAELDSVLRTAPLSRRSVAVLAAPWWAAQRDTAALEELLRRADSTARATQQPAERALARYAAAGARALRALVRGDTAAAIRGLTALPDSACTQCVTYKLILAQLVDERRMDGEAARLLAGDPPGSAFPTDGFWQLYRAHLAARRGDRRAAAEYYTFVRDVWLHGDENLQPYVREARGFLARMHERH